MRKLSDPAIRATFSPGSVNCTQRLKFLCPSCLKSEISIEVWSEDHKTLEYTRDGETYQVRVWHAEQGPHRDWDTLNVTPSIDSGPHVRQGCAGWHGHIVNGELIP